MYDKWQPSNDNSGRTLISISSIWNSFIVTGSLNYTNGCHIWFIWWIFSVKAWNLALNCKAFEPWSNQLCLDESKSTCFQIETIKHVVEIEGHLTRSNWRQGTFCLEIIFHYECVFFPSLELVIKLLVQVNFLLM